MSKAPTLPDKLAERETMLLARLEVVRKLKAAADPLYAQEGACTNEARLESLFVLAFTAHGTPPMIRAPLLSAARRPRATTPLVDETIRRCSQLGSPGRQAPAATENRIRDGADAAMGYPRFGMLDLLKLLGGLLVGLFNRHVAALCTSLPRTAAQYGPNSG